MSSVRSDDLIATVEKYLVDAWPDPDWERFPLGRGAPSDWTGTEATARVTIQFDPLPPAAPTRVSEDWLEWGMRIQCWTRKDLTLYATRMAEDFREILKDTVFDLIDRSDGSTVVGSVEIKTAVITPEDIDRRDQRFALCEVLGWARVPS